MSIWNLLVLLLALGSFLGVILLYFKLSNSKGQESLEGYLKLFSRDQERLEKVFKDEMGRNREEVTNGARAAREELSRQLTNLSQVNEQKLEKVRETLENQLRALLEDNGRRLDQMRSVVDEKLQATLERRLTESFRMVSERLEKVHQGLGEMQSLAASVGDLKAVLNNVKTRGTWGEVQLESLLSQVLSAEQYSKNVATKTGSDDRVEFAIRLPGRDTANGKGVWLPIDAKFPMEDYQRLNEALEKGDGTAATEAIKNLTQRVKAEAKNIRDKYLDPPNTTDFAILFLPTEGLYAEVLRQPGLLDYLQGECRVVITGPTTLAAILNSLQIGFRTLAIEKRSSEVWVLLGMVKKEFGVFATILEKTQKKLQEASNTIEDATKKTRTIERKLKEVEALPGGALESSKLAEEDSQ
ncbi:MAG TPA: DNA recombination protein RmuC [bacterium]|nr:DNA recombination protein RmuC [bacterium]